MKLLLYLDQLLMMNMLMHLKKIPKFCLPLQEILVLLLLSLSRLVYPSIILLLYYVVHYPLLTLSFRSYIGNYIFLIRHFSCPILSFFHVVVWREELKIVFPNAQRMNRGGQVISEIIETCRSHDFTDVILVHENRGVPDGIVISHLPFGPTAYFGLLNVVTRHDIKDKKSMGTMSEAYPHLIFDKFSTKLGERTVNILKHLFPVPKPDTKRILTFANQSDYISFRHHVYEKHGGPKSIELKEVGPRFELRLYQIKLGTMDQDEAQIEWVIKPYMNTSKKRTLLGD
ncbi:hypothetical protein AABB24_038694 [Solanum stoloniferum]|uniref:Brix domain-containing protein n=1 Tax=Solanum stoloniferum TaxID=62892 RepID=A0ABD2QYT0_9SOLN